MFSYQTLPSLEKMSGKTEELFGELRQTKDPRIRGELILRHKKFVKQLAFRFINRGKSLESLVSVGTIGLIKAIDRYDISRRVKFTTYATYCVLGEIKRYFRDKAWVIKVPRSLKELNSIVQSAIEDLTARLGRSPTTQEVSQKLDIPSEDIVEAIEAGRSYQPYSLDQKLKLGEEDSICFLDILSQEDWEFYDLFDKIDLKGAIKALNKREQMIVELFYFRNYSQVKIAQRLGISQMHVSRLLRGAIESLKKVLIEKKVTFSIQKTEA